MYFYQDPQFGERMITLMAALVLVLQIAMVAQRWLVTNIRVFAAQSLLLAGIAATIAYFNNAPHIYFVAALTIVVKVIFLPVLMERLVVKIELRQEIAPLINIPLSVLIAGGLTIVGYVVAESFYHPRSRHHARHPRPQHARRRDFAFSDWVLHDAQPAQGADAGYRLAFS
jgi:hypothetical protein